MQRKCKNREIRLKTGKNGHGKKLQESAGKKIPIPAVLSLHAKKTIYNFVTISYISVGDLTGA